MKPREITKRREKLGLTKEGLAQKVEVSPNTIRFWEKGIVTPKPKNEKKLREVLRNEQ